MYSLPQLRGRYELGFDGYALCHAWWTGAPSVRFFEVTSTCSPHPRFRPILPFRYGKKRHHHCGVFGRSDVKALVWVFARISALRMDWKGATFGITPSLSVPFVSESLRKRIGTGSYEPFPISRSAYIADTDEREEVADIIL